MSPSIIAIVLHIGKLIQAIKDVEKGIADLVSGHPSKDDLKAVLEDICDLVKSGLINVPGISAEQISAVVMDIEKSVG